MQALLEKILAKKKIARHEARKLWKAELSELFKGATKIREFYCGKKVELCSIVNAKSGRCPEDCIFCSQSAHHKTTIQKYPLISNEKILEAAESAIANKANCFSIVTSGKGIKNDAELRSISEAISKIRGNFKLKRSASLGILSRDQMNALKLAGLLRYHHNLETSKNFFPKICTTHTFEERLKTVELAKRCGFEVCCGGILGLGESDEDILDLAFTIRDLEIDSVPINFLNPIQGTTAGSLPLLRPLRALRIIAVFRFILPDREIKVCGGRNIVLRDLQPLIFSAGASGILIGSYLTTAGEDPKTDLQMIKDLGLEPKL